MKNMKLGKEVRLRCNEDLQATITPHTERCQQLLSSAFVHSFWASLLFSIQKFEKGSLRNEKPET